MVCIYIIYTYTLHVYSIHIYYNIKKLHITFQVWWDILNVRIKVLWLKYNMYDMALIRNLGLKEHKYIMPMASCC